MFYGLPWWLWVVLAVGVAFGLKVSSFYARYRAFCRGIREDLSAQVHAQHAEVKVLGERLGNLVVRMPDGSEKLWEMAEVYTRVLRQHGMGSDSSVRGAVYQDAVSALFAPDRTAPLALATHGERIKPQIVPPSALEGDTQQTVHQPVPGLGLEEIYLLDYGMIRRVLTEADLATLGIDRATLRRTALANLRRDLPPDLVSSARSNLCGSACQLGDGFDAARLLLIPQLLKSREEVLALVPHRDMLLLLPPGMAEEPMQLAESIHLLNDGHSAKGSHPHLLERAVRVTREGFELV